MKLDLLVKGKMETPVVHWASVIVLLYLIKNVYLLANIQVSKHFNINVCFLVPIELSKNLSMNIMNESNNLVPYQTSSNLSKMAASQNDTTLRGHHFENVWWGVFLDLLVKLVCSFKTPMKMRCLSMGLCFNSFDLASPKNFSRKDKVS